jgi:hypothetical protein
MEQLSDTAVDVLGAIIAVETVVARPRGKKRQSSGIMSGFGAYADLGGGNGVGLSLVPRARSVVGPETLRAPRIVATGREAPRTISRFR